MQNMIAELSQAESQALTQLLQLAKHDPLQLEDVWMLMDYVWDKLGCDNTQLDEQKVAEFYRHPVWVLNGLFIEQDAISMCHRGEIARWINRQPFATILDCGGGFGTLARLIAAQDLAILIDVYEPFPSQTALEKAKAFPNIRFVNQVERQYDCVVSLDVLEHVPDPLSLLAEMIKQTKAGGYLVVAHSFRPEIKCHLPCTFHFHYTFNQFAKAMGLGVLGRCGNSHAMIYQKVSATPINWQQVRQMELRSQSLHLLNAFIGSIVEAIKRPLRKCKATFALKT